MKFNIIGLGLNYSTIPPDKYKHCVIHPGIRLTSKPDEPGVLWCCQCGTPYLPKDTISEERFEADHGPTNKTRIITGNKRKMRYVDETGNEITDPTLINDMIKGIHVIRYEEYKVEGDAKKPERHVLKE